MKRRKMSKRRLIYIECLGKVGKLGSRGCATREGTSEEKPMKFASSNIRLQSKGTGIEKTRRIKNTTI